MARSGQGAAHGDLRSRRVRNRRRSGDRRQIALLNDRIIKSLAIGMLCRPIRAVCLAVTRAIALAHSPFLCWRSGACDPASCNWQVAHARACAVNWRCRLGGVGAFLAPSGVEARPPPPGVPRAVLRHRERIAPVSSSATQDGCEGVSLGSPHVRPGALLRRAQPRSRGLPAGRAPVYGLEPPTIRSVSMTVHALQEVECRQPFARRSPPRSGRHASTSLRPTG
jgi:hypothetical protein